MPNRIYVVHDRTCTATKRTEQSIQGLKLRLHGDVKKAPAARDAKFESPACGRPPPMSLAGRPANGKSRCTTLAGAWNQALSSHGGTGPVGTKCANSGRAAMRQNPDDRSTRNRCRVRTRVSTNPPKQLPDLSDPPPPRGGARPRRPRAWPLQLTRNPGLVSRATAVGTRARRVSKGRRSAMVIGPRNARKRAGTWMASFLSNCSTTTAPDRHRAVLLLPVAFKAGGHIHHFDTYSSETSIRL